MSSKARRRRARRLFRFERKSQPLQSRGVFAGRVAAGFAAAVLLILISLLGGMAGYAHFEQMEWVDAFANAAMILSGMGPLCELKSPGGKLFAGFYALYSGLALVVATGLILAPIVHRVLHHFHLSDESGDNRLSE